MATIPTVVTEEWIKNLFKKTLLGKISWNTASADLTKDVGAWIESKHSRLYLCLTRLNHALEIKISLCQALSAYTPVFICDKQTQEGDTGYQPLCELYELAKKCAANIDGKISCEGFWKETYEVMEDQ